MQIFPVLCLTTFLVFTSYWLISFILHKSINFLRKQPQKQMNQQSNNPLVQATQSNSKVDEGSSCLQPEYQIKIKEGASKITTLTNQSSQNQQIGSTTNIQNISGQSGHNLSVDKSNRNEDLLMASVNNELNVAMIQPSLVDKKNDKQQKEEKEEKEFQILGEIYGINQNELEGNQEVIDNMKGQQKGQQIKQDEYLIKSQQPQCCIPHHPEQLHPQKREQRSQLQILQALSPKHEHNQVFIIPQNISHIQPIIDNHEHQQLNKDQHPQLTGIERQDSEGDLVMAKLVMQIDQLFLTNQQQFQNIMNKYKIQQARYTDHYQQAQAHPSQQQQQQINNLQSQIQQLRQSLQTSAKHNQHLQIAISQYKQISQQLKQQVQQKQKQLQQQQQKLQQEQQEQPQPSGQQAILKQVQCLEEQLQAHKQKYQQLQHQNRKNINLCDQLRKKNVQYQEEYLKLLEKNKKDKEKTPKRELSPMPQAKDNRETRLLQQLSNSQHQKFRIQNQLNRIRQQHKELKEKYAKQKYKNSTPLNSSRNKQPQAQETQPKQCGQQQQKVSLNFMQLQQLRNQLEKLTWQNNKLQNELQQKLQSQLEQLAPHSVHSLECSQSPPSPSPQQKIAQLQSQLKQLKSSQPNKQLYQQIENLKNEIQFAQTQIRMFQESEIAYLSQIGQLEKRLGVTLDQEVIELRAKIARMQPIVNQYQTLQKRYFQTKLKYQKLILQRNNKQRHEKVAPQLTNITSPSQQKQQHQQHQQHQQQQAQNYFMSPKNNRLTFNGNASNGNEDSPIAIMNSGVSVVNSDKMKADHYSRNSAQTVNAATYKFLNDCAFMTSADKQFLHQSIKSLLKGILKTQKLYNSKTNQKNPHQFIDDLRGILLIIQLQNQKLIGAYTHEPFTQSHPQSSSQNIAFIFDITNRKIFTNQSGINSISYNPVALVWGFNQIMLKFEEPQVMYTNFCRNHNIYWDGQYRIDEFIGSEKQWARITQYEIFRVSKI